MFPGKDSKKGTECVCVCNCNVKIVNTNTICKKRRNKEKVFFYETKVFF